MQLVVLGPPVGGLDRGDRVATRACYREPCVGCTVPDRGVLGTYPFVYLIKIMGLAGAKSSMYEQIGYSLADVIAKAVFGVLIWAIASEKSAVEESGKLMPH